MNIFKKVSGSGENIFKKSGEMGRDIFKKVSPSLEKISAGAGRAENVLQQVSKVSGKIAGSPITQMLPFGSAIASGAGAISGLAGLGAKGAGQVSQLANTSNYRKGGVNKQLENIADIQRRGREIEQTRREVGKVFM